MPGSRSPPSQEVLVLREPDEVVHRGAPHRRNFSPASFLAERAVGIPQIGRLVGAPANLAGVAILILGAALRALALDEAIGQEPLVDLAIELLDRAPLDRAVRVEGPENTDRVLFVLRRVRRVEDVVQHFEGAVVRGVLGVEAGHELLGRNARASGVHLDGGSVRVVGADEGHIFARRPERADVHVGLHRLDQVAEVEAAVRVRQGHGDEGAGGHRYRSSLIALRRSASAAVRRGVADPPLFLTRSLPPRRARASGASGSGGGAANACSRARPRTVWGPSAPSPRALRRPPEAWDCRSSPLRRSRP